MSTFSEVVEKVSQLSSDELEEIKALVDKQLINKRMEELGQALTEAKQKSADGNLRYYATGEDIVASLNED